MLKSTKIIRAFVCLLPWSALADAEVPSDPPSRGIAQERAPEPAGPLPFFSPPAPVAPEVVARDDKGRITVRATRLNEPLVLDGRLDDAVYSKVKSVTGFVQQEPDEGKPETEKTETWVLFDDRHLYVSVRCWDSQPNRMIANELRRDHPNIRQDENFSLVLDTLYDRRNGVYFATNPLGAVRDQAIGDEGRSNNLDWNTVWEVKASMDDGGWSLEMVIPYKSLRFKGVGAQVWGFNIRRTVKWKNETSSLAQMLRAQGGRGLFIFSSAATLVGVEIPGTNRNLEIKPYALSSLITDQTAAEPFSNDPDGAVGVDVKYGLTSGLTGDFTYNTDFAQVEEDQQEINLTRFNLLFPEKRDFFLEGQAIFAFGGGSPSGGGDGLAPIPFFSRRIGLTEEGVDPIRVGGRVAGRAGPFQIGALDIQTRGVAGNPLIPATNFSVLRVRRDILRRSDIGVIGTYRNTSLTPSARSNGVFGADANFAFFRNVNLNAFYLTSRTPLQSGGTTGGDRSSYRGNFEYLGDSYGLSFEHLYVGEGFQPELGFLKREAFRRNYLVARFSPRPKSPEWIRRLVWQLDYDHITDPFGRLETRKILGQFRVELDNSDSAEIEYANNFEFLPEPFEISEGVILPVGEYDFQNVKLSYTLGAQHRLPSTISYQRGGFWSGDRDALSFDGRIQAASKFSFEPRIGLNWVRLPEGNFTTRLIGARLTMTFSPRMALSSFVQYKSSSNSLSTSLRFRWEYRPGSDLFFVYSDGRKDLSSDPFLANRTIAVKFTRLFRF